MTRTSYQTDHKTFEVISADSQDFWGFDSFAEATAKASEVHGRLYIMHADDTMANGFLRIRVESENTKPVSPTIQGRLADSGGHTLAQELEAARKRRLETQAARERRRDFAWSKAQAIIETIATCSCGCPGRYSRNGIEHAVACSDPSCEAESVVHALKDGTLAELVESWNDGVAILSISNEAVAVCN